MAEHVSGGCGRAEGGVEERATIVELRAAAADARRQAPNTFHVSQREYKKVSIVEFYTHRVTVGKICSPKEHCNIF